MDLLETATQEYFEHLNCGRVIFEPLGCSQPPDFSLGSSIAVECTRLTKVVDGINISETEPRISNTIKDTIESVIRPDLGRCFFISVKYEIPNDKRRTIRAIKETLIKLDLRNHWPSGYFSISSDLAIRITHTSEKYPTTFSLGSINHSKSFGWVESDLITQSHTALNIKRTKMFPIETKFSEWWLAVGSSQTEGLRESQLAPITEGLGQSGFLDRIIFIKVEKPKRSKSILL